MAAVAPIVNVPQSVGGTILPGWMTRETAVALLTSECLEPALDAQQAGAIWEDFHQRVMALPEREARAPARLPLTELEQREATGFLAAMRRVGAQNILDVIKVDPALCTVHQLQVITDRSAEYARELANPNSKIRLSLPPAPPSRQIQIQGFPNDIRVPVPHAEFMFAFNNPGGFQIIEPPKHITVSAYDNRLFLWAGYHRSFAAISNENPEGMERSLVVVLTNDADFILADTSPNQVVRDMVRGLRPPLLADFLDERLSMRVRLRKKRCVLRIQSRIEWLDDES